jgi:hypothetical protein
LAGHDRDKNRKELNHTEQHKLEVKQLIPRHQLSDENSENRMKEIKKSSENVIIEYNERFRIDNRNK